MLFGHDYYMVDMSYSDEYTAFVAKELSGYLDTHFELRKDMIVVNACKKCGSISRNVTYIILEVL